MPVDSKLLTDRVAAVIDTLTRYLPRYVAGVRRVPDRPGTFEVVNPFDPDRPMRIGTARGEATLAFGGCQDRFAADADSTETDLAGEVLVKVVLLATGAEASYSAWDGDACLGNGWLRTGADPRDELGLFPRADRLVVLGWFPGDDAEVSLVPARVA